MATYDLGDLVRCSAVFKNAAGTNTDPTTVTAKVKTPTGVTTTYVYGTDVALVRDSAGNYHVDITTTEAGTWSYRFVGTGAVVQADETVFYVEASLFS